MDVLVTYDVSTLTPEGRRRLRKIAQACKNFGQRVQQSVFECSVNEMQYERLRSSLVEIIDESADNLRIYRLRSPKADHIEQFGIQKVIDFKAPLVV